MRRPILAALTLTGLLGALAGCATASKNAAITDTLQIYAATLRWSDWSQAIIMLDPESLKTHPVTSLDIERFHQYRVSSYHDSGPLGGKDGNVQVIAEISLVNVNTQEERSVIDHQSWHYDEKSKRWLLTTGLPNIAPH